LQYYSDVDKQSVIKEYLARKRNTPKNISEEIRIISIDLAKDSSTLTYTIYLPKTVISETSQSKLDYDRLSTLRYMCRDKMHKTMHAYGSSVIFRQFDKYNQIYLEVISNKNECANI